MTAILHLKAGKPVEVTGPESVRPKVIWLNILSPIDGAPPRSACFVYTHRAAKRDDNNEPYAHYREVDAIMLNQEPSAIITPDAVVPRQMPGKGRRG